MQQAFTLIELMIALAVAALVFSLGVPSFTQLIQNNRIATQLNQFSADYAHARTEAIKRGNSVSICKRNIAGSACDSEESWSDGWIVFADLGGDGELDDTDTVLSVHEKLPGNITMNFSRSLDRITVDSLGMAFGYNTTITFCDDRGVTHAKAVAIANTGRLRSLSASSCQ